MGDKHKSENQKPVKNTLLSGASHGFPFENFQGSSMLIPVSQDSPSVLTDSVGDVNQSDGRSVESSDNRGLSSVESIQKSNGEGTKTSSQGYAGIFNSFFGGGAGQSKQELDLALPPSSQGINPETFLQSTGPPVTVPNVQTFSPGLQVPPGSPGEPASQPPPNPIGFVHSTDSPFQQTQPGSTWSHHQFFKQSPVEDAALGSFPQNVGMTSQVPEKKEVPPYPASSQIGFESFSDAGPRPPQPPLIGSFKAQSSIDLPVSGGSSDNTASTLSFFNPVTPQDSSTSGLYLYQTRSSSVDSFQPPPGGMPPPPLSALSSGPPLSSAPPTSNSTFKTYRRDLHKRLAYAPVPGLTSNTVVSSSYLTPSDNLPSYSPLPYSGPTPPPSKYPLSASLSQPAMAVSATSSQPSDSSLNMSSSMSSSSAASTTSASSLQNFFALNYTSSNTSTSQMGATNSAEAFQASPNLSSASVGFSSQNPSLQDPPYPPQPFTHQMSNLSLSSSASGYSVSSLPVHPPIMSTKEQTTSPQMDRPSSPSVIPASFNHLANMGHSGIIYRPAYHHWFLRIETKDGKEIWQPFSMTDSLALEQALNSDTLTGDAVVPTDGGRYDVNVTSRTRTAVYWEEKPQRVMRCSWFYKSTTESRLHPYDENTAYNLEEEYKKAVTTNTWNRKVDLPSGDYVIMYGPSSIALFQCAPQTPEGWEAETDFSENTSHRPKIVKRGVLDDFEIDDGESTTVDHLIFVVHGIGSVCDLKFRTIEEAGGPRDFSTFLRCLVEKVDGFRNKSLQLIKSHFRTSAEQGLVNRIEILPVSWHGHLHGETTGVDKKLQTITLKSIPRLRNFTNDTLLDILFYTSPVYCQTIMQQVGNEINSLYNKFLSRNPNYKGGISLAGHSLGSLILFDMLCHQKPVVPRPETKKHTNTSIVSQEVHTTVSGETKKPTLSHKMSYVIGRAGTGQPYIEYPQLSFQPLAFFAMGSPIGMFVTVRGIDSLGLDFSFPTCSRFFNIFHPFDPVAYRIEALISPELSEKRPVLIPHHKGRKRMHLELKETMARVGADLKQRLIDSVRSTWNTVYQLTLFGRADDGLEQEMGKVIEKQLERQQTETAAHCLTEASYDTEFEAGKLNQGRRIDYVLQEAPLESFNEYVSALISHVIYWDSEDTMLLILKEVYGSMGISPDNQSSVIPGQAGSGGLDNSAIVSPTPPAYSPVETVATATTMEMPLG